MIVYIPLRTNYTATTITKRQFKAIIFPEKHHEGSHLIAFVTAIQTARYTRRSSRLITRIKFSHVSVDLSVYLHTRIIIIIIITLLTIISIYYKLTKVTSCPLDAQSIPSSWCFDNTFTCSNKFAILLLPLSSPNWTWNFSPLPIPGELKWGLGLRLTPVYAARLGL